MPDIKKIFSLELALAVAIFLGVVLRLSYPDTIEFKGDEYTALKLAYSNVHGGGLALVGLESSVGLPNPPFFVYLLSIPGDRVERVLTAGGMTVAAVAEPVQPRV